MCLSFPLGGKYGLISEHDQLQLRGDNATGAGDWVDPNAGSSGDSGSSAADSAAALAQANADLAKAIEGQTTYMKNVAGTQYGALKQALAAVVSGWVMMMMMLRTRWLQLQALHELVP